MVGNPYGEADKRIVSEVYTSSEPMDNLKVLCDSFGSRFPGSSGDNRSVRWMVKRLKSYGIENAHHDEFKIPGWKRRQAKLSIISPMKKNIECISLPHGIGGEVEARLIFLGDGALEEYIRRKEEIEGSIVMVTSAKPFGMSRLVHRSEKYTRSILAGAKGWIFMNHYPAYGPSTGGINPIIPSVSVSYEDGSFLTRLLEKGKDVIVRIKTRDKNMDVITHNVICDIGGTSDSNEYVLAGSHYDGHDISQGAMDPASGTVTILEIARLLNMVKSSLNRRIRLVCFGAEETGLNGSNRYVNINSKELGRVRFMLNLDSIGNPGKKGLLLHDCPELETFVRQSAKEMKIEIPVAQVIRPYSDHWPFFMEGIPCGIGGDPSKTMAARGRGYGHTKYDTVDKVAQSQLRLAAAVYARLLLRMANTDAWPANRRSPKRVNSYIKKHGYRDVLDLPNKLKAYVRTWKHLPPETKEWLNRSSAW